MSEDNKIEELEAEYQKELLKKVTFLKADNEAKEKAMKDKQEKEDADKQAALELQKETDIINKIGKQFGLLDQSARTIDSQSAINSKKKTGTKQEESMRDFHKKYSKAKNIKRVEYGSTSFIAGDVGFAFTDADTGCEDNVDAWSPADVYCDLIWQAAQCGRQLSGAVTMRACDINAGDGLTVQIRTISADTLGAALGACECATCVSNTFSTYSLTLHRYDIYKVVCELDIFDVGDQLKSAMVEAMSRGFIAGIDTAIYAALIAATPGQTQHMGARLSCTPAMTTSCCSFANLYDNIVLLEAKLRAAGYGSKGFKLIVSPTVAAYLKFKEGINTPAWVNNISMDGNKLSKVGDIDVIEYCGAQACSDSTSTTLVMAVLLDPERAIGEAYGKAPHLLVDNDPIECDSTKLVMRSYIAIAVLDAGAIRFIYNA